MNRKTRNPTEIEQFFQNAACFIAFALLLYLLVCAGLAYGGEVSIDLKVDAKRPGAVKAYVVISPEGGPPGFPEEFDLEEGFIVPDGFHAEVIIRAVEPVDMQEVIRELQVMTGRRPAENF